MHKRSEQFGPLRLTRTVKEDGRALLLYGALGAPAQAGPTGHDGHTAGDGRALPRSAGATDVADGGTILRFAELRGEQVIYAIERQERTFLPAAEHCPLCPTRPGAGERTEIPYAAFELAVFDNRFPALRTPRGAAEVVVYTDAHIGSLGTLAPRRVRDLMWVWRQRYAELGARADVDYVYIFENRGVEVGVTLHHPHGQIYAYPFLPPIPTQELAADARLGGCAVCELAGRELEEDGGARRVVYESEHVLAYVPFAARYAYEAHVALRAHRPALTDCEPAELDALADALRALVRGYDMLFRRPFPYVMALHQAPTGGAHAGAGHVHVELYPPLRTATKLKYLAGSEQGAGVFVADTLPEETAPLLRAAVADAT